jgi:hypothetical protein
MKNKLFIDESEKSRILEMHKNAISKHLLNEESLYVPNNKNININPKKLKLGDGTSKNPSLNADVKILQGKLIQLGCLPKGSDDGRFGNITNKALLRYQKEGSCKSVGIKTQNDNTTNDLHYTNKPLSSDYLGRGGEFERNLYGGNIDKYLEMKTFINNIPQSKKSSLPLHIRALMDYLVGRTEPFTAKDLTADEQIFLKKVAIANAKRGLNYPLWKEIGAGNLPTSMTVAGSEKENKKLLDKGGQGSLLKPELAGQFMYTLGRIDPPNIRVSPDKSKVTVLDTYDFNTEGKTKEDLMKSFVDQVGSWWNGKSTLYSVIRNTVAFRETGEYKGFPVNITV